MSAGSTERAETDRTAWAMLGELLRPARGRLWLAVGCQVVAALAGVVPFVAVVSLGRHLLAEDSPDHGWVWTLVLIAAGALLVRALFGLAAGALAHAVDADLQLRVRRRLVGHLRRVPPAWMSGRGSGAVNRALQEDVEALHHVVAHTPSELASAVVVPVACMVYLGLVDWRLMLLTLVCPIAGVLIYRQLMSPGRRRDRQDMERAMVRVAGASVEFVQGISVVKLFGAGGRAHRRFARAADDFSDYFTGWVRTVVNLGAAADIVLSPPVVLLVILAGGTGFVAGGDLPPADLLAFLLLGLALTAPVSALGHGLDNVIAAREAAGRIGELLTVRALPAPAHPRAPEGHRVVFDGVGFTYDGGVEALRDIGLTLEPGTRTALVGPSGSGKSTVARLLARFDDPTRGRVTVGGADLRDIPDDELCRSVSFVFQDVILLHASLHDNIAVALPGASREQVERAAGLAGIHERIATLPHGYDAVVGEEAQLSGGEAQRLSVARAFLRDAPVLVLDEATAFADPESEAALQRALRELTAGRTLLVIAHRPASVAAADRIVVLDRGRIADSGTHRELLARSPYYARMWQTGGAPNAVLDVRS